MAEKVSRLELTFKDSVETFLGDLPLDVKVWNGLLINKGTVNIPTHEKNKLYQVFHVLCVF